MNLLIKKYCDKKPIEESMPQHIATIVSILGVCLKECDGERNPAL